jgi:transposase
VLKLFLERLKLLDTQIQSLDKLVAQEMKKHEEAVIRVAEMPGFGVDSAQQVIAEVGVAAETFPSAGKFSSWVGVCPGSHISAEQNDSSRSPKGESFCTEDPHPSGPSGGAEEGMPFPVGLPPVGAQTRL